MTRYLSQALGAEEPAFSQRLEQLEQASGAPSADIRLTTENMQKVRAKIAALGLDPADTTGEELYAALQERLQLDEQRVQQALGIAPDAAASDVLAALTHFLDETVKADMCFAVRQATARKLLKKRPPKVAMKRLGYRSLESFIKHEPVANIYAAAVLCESPAWHRSFRELYAKLSPADFERRRITIARPTSKRWQTLAAGFVGHLKHNILVFNELGSIVLLPLDERIDGLAITTLLQVFGMCNEIRTHSSFAKLHQVNANFGKIIQHSSTEEPHTSAHLAGEPVPWRMVQRYFAEAHRAAGTDIFEPHVQAEDLTWRHAEDILAGIAPTLSFWQDTQSLCLIDDSGKPVSLNAMDVALNYCNHLSFGERIVRFARDNLWHELMVRYLKHENLERTVLSQIGNDLGGISESVRQPEFALAE